MSYTDRQLYNTIQYTLLEAPNNGASYGSGLYTASEVVGRTNYRLDLFQKLTSIHVRSNVQDTASANSRNQIATNLTDLIDIIEVSYNNGTGWVVLPKGSTDEADAYITNQSTTASTPSFYTIDVAPLLGICLYPSPSGAGTLRMTYVPKIGTLPTIPDGTTINMPDDYIPYIKFGVLADLFSKAGETYDPQRASLCESLYQLGIQVAKGAVAGSADPKGQ